MTPRLEVDRAYFEKSNPIPEHEIFHLPIVGGNPVFDFETPRKVYIRSTFVGYELKGEDSFPSIKNLYGTPSGDIILYEYELDSKGHVILDEHGRPKKVVIENADKPGVIEYQRWRLQGVEMELSVPEDNYKIEQLLKVPRNASVTHIDGLHTNVAQMKTFYIYDPEQEKANETVIRESITRAVDYVKKIQERALFSYLVFLDTTKYFKGVMEDLKPRKQRNGSLEYDKEQIKYVLESCARELPREFLNVTKNNIALNADVLMALAEHFNVIKDVSEGFIYYPINRERMHIGATKEQAYVYLREHETIRRDVVERINYRDFLDDTPVVVQDVIYDGDSPEFSFGGENAFAQMMMEQHKEAITRPKEVAGDSKIAALEAQIAQLTQMMAKQNVALESVTVAPEAKKPGRKPGQKNGTGKASLAKKK